MQIPTITDPAQAVLVDQPQTFRCSTADDSVVGFDKNTLSYGYNYQRLGEWIGPAFNPFPNKHLRRADVLSTSSMVVLTDSNEDANWDWKTR